jgi:hypothetical protein
MNPGMQGAGEIVKKHECRSSAALVLVVQDKLAHVVTIAARGIEPSNPSREKRGGGA